MDRPSIKPAAPVVPVVSLLIAIRVRFERMADVLVNADSRHSQPHGHLEIDLGFPGMLTAIVD